MIRYLVKKSSKNCAAIAFVLALPASVIHSQDNRHKSLMRLVPQVYVREKKSKCYAVLFPNIIIQTAQLPVKYN